MTRKEKKIIQAREAELWNEMYEYRYNYAISNIDKSVGYSAAFRQLESLDYTIRMTSHWSEIYMLMEEFKIEPDYSLRTDFPSKLCDYFNDKD